MVAVEVPISLAGSGPQTNFLDFAMVPVGPCSGRQIGCFIAAIMAADFGP